MKSSDGATISYAHKLKIKKRFARQTFELIRARIDKTLFIDDPENNSKQWVEYNIIIDGGPRDGALYTNIPHLADLGGFNNYTETILSEHTGSSVSRPSNRRLPYNKTTNATYVIVLFLYGFDENPVIVGGWPHPRKKGATKADGVRQKGEFNGVEWLINKNGELIVKSLGGPRDKNGNLTNSERGETSITIDANGSILVNRNDKAKVDITDNEIKLIKGDDDAIVNITNDIITLIKGDEETTISMSDNEIKLIRGDDVSTITIDSGVITLVRGSNRVKVSDSIVDIGGTSNLVATDGVITGKSFDFFTGTNHLDYSSIVRAKKV